MELPEWNQKLNYFMQKNPQKFLCIFQLISLFKINLEFLVS